MTRFPIRGIDQHTCASKRFNNNLITWSVAIIRRFDEFPFACVAKYKLCPIDLIAIEVIRYLRSIDKKVPYDVSVTGYGAIQFSNIISPRLTTVRQPLAEMGAEAVKSLQRRIDSPDAATEDIVLTVHAIIRSSMLAKICGVVAA